MTKDGMIEWGSFYKAVSFYFVLAFSVLTYLFHHKLYNHEVGVMQFRDAEYCVAYARSQLIPAHIEAAKVENRSWECWGTKIGYESSSTDTKMRYIVTPHFSQKLSNSDSTALSSIRRSIDFVSTKSKGDIVNIVEVTPLMTDSGIFVYRHGSVRVFFTFANDAEGEYVLLADLAAKDGS